eukprot:scaffold61628_cov74-Phaeocystis_antarctica.AAC.4
MGSAARFGAAHRAVKQGVHSMPTTVCVEFLSEKCRGSTSNPIDAFFPIAILTGLGAALADGGGHFLRAQRGGNGRFDGNH